MTRSPGAALAVSGCAILLTACGQQLASPTKASTPIDQPVSSPGGAEPSGTCAIVAIEVAPGVTGQSTPLLAIHVFLQSGTASFALPPRGWASVDGRLYTSGAAAVEMTRLPNGGYVVTTASNC